MAGDSVAHAVISRKAAKAAKLTQYYTGKPCLHGHFAPRYVSNCQCRSCGDANIAAWRLKNPHLVKRGRDAWTAANKDYEIEVRKRWRERNRDRSRISKRNAKAKRKSAAGRHTAEDIARIMKQQRGRCAYCRQKLGEEYHVDHITPIAKGGTNDARNIQLTCAKCNLEKSARDPIHHAQILGLLL